MLQWLKDRWVIVTAVSVPLAVVVIYLTFFVRVGTIVSWFWPQSQTQDLGQVHYTFVDGPFQMPHTYDQMPESLRNALKASRAFTRIHIQNVSKVTMAHPTLSLPVSSIVEVISQDSIAVNLGLGESFGIGDLKPNDYRTIFIWTPRPLTDHDLITITHEGGATSIRPSSVMTTDEVEALKYGFYGFRLATILLIVVVIILLVLVLWLVLRRRPAKRQHQRKPKDTALPATGGSSEA